MPSRARPARKSHMTVLDVANRSRSPISAPNPANGAASYGVLNDSIGRVVLAGWLIVAVFFGGIGSWAVIAPLNGAVVANAVVKVEGNRKSIQHLDGGIVKELRVKEGARVKAGDVMIVLDDTQARAEYDVLSQEYL